MQRFLNMTNQTKALALCLTLAIAGWFALPVTASPSRVRGVVSFYDNATSVTANNDILSTDVTPQFTGSFLRVTVVLPISSVLNVTMDDGTSAITSGLNSSTALNALDVYTFDIPCTPGLSYNLQPETTQSSGIDLLLIQEIKP